MPLNDHKITAFTKPITALPTRPTAGTGAQLKADMQSSAEELRIAHNNLIDEIADMDESQTQSLDEHKTSADHDGRYYTETEVNSLLAAIDEIIQNNELDIEQKLTALNQLVAANETDIEAKYSAHINSTSAHTSKNIVFDKTGTPMTAIDVESALKELYTRISTIVASVGTSNTEIVDARTSAARSKVYTVLKDRLEAIESDIDTINTATQEATASIISLPSTVFKGPFVNIAVQGRTLKSETNYTASTWAEWTKTNATGDGTGITMTMVSAQSSSIILNTNVKTNTKYGVLLNVPSNSMASNSLFGELANVVFAAALGSANETGNKKYTLTTGASITNNRVRIQTNTTGGTGAIKVTDIRIFELPTGSEIEADFTNLTADQLAVKYQYVKGDSVKNTGPVRLKAPGKNLFNGDRLEIGSINSTTGADDNAVTQRARSKGYIKIAANTSYYIKTTTGYSITRVFFYDSSNNLISTTLIQANGGTFTTPTNAVSLRTNFQKGDGTPTITQAEIDALKTATQLELGTTATTYEAYKSTEAYLPEIGRKVAVSDEVGMGIDGNWYKTVKNSSDKVLSGNDLVSSEYTHGTNTYAFISHATTGYFPDAKGNDAVIGYCADGNFKGLTSATIDERGTFLATSNFRLYTHIEKSKIDAMAGATLIDKAKAYFNLYPVTLNYQLATEIKTQREDIAKLIAEPNGQIQTDFCYKETSIYTDKLSIINTTTPIKSLESVVKITDSGETPIDTATCTIAGDGLSFTSTALTAGDKVEFVAFYDSSTSCLPKIIYTYSNDLKGAVEQNTIGVGNLSKDVTELTADLQLETKQRAWTRIASVKLSAVTAQVDFTGIPTKYKRLMINVRARTDTAVNSGTINIKINNDAGANYYRRIVSLGSSYAQPFAGTGNVIAFDGALNSKAGTPTYTDTEIRLQNIATAKSVYGASHEAYTDLSGTKAYLLEGAYIGTGLINRITLTAVGASVTGFDTDSEFELWGC